MNNFEELLRETVRTQTIMAESLKGISECSKDIKDSMCKINDNFAYHKDEFSTFKKNVLRFLLASVILNLILLGAFNIARIAGVDILKIIQ